MQELPEINSKKLLGMPVYSIQEGLHLGQIKSLILDAKEQCVAALLIERKRFNREERVLPFPAVDGVGEDAVTIEKAALLERKGVNSQYMKALKHPLYLIGAKAFTIGGKTLGKVEEYRLRRQDGLLSALILHVPGLFKESILVERQDIITIAPHTVMLRDSAVANAVAVVNPLFSGMENAAGLVKDKAANLKNSTLETTKKLSANWEDRINKRKIQGDSPVDEEEDKKIEAEAKESGLPHGPTPQAHTAADICTPGHSVLDQALPESDGQPREQRGE
ncbi:MAG: PRC-barrel domain-containing protein [Firmicutes bacterium]|nr:PRC-barrel domain-containing protein [Bacillota bacterium]